MLRIRELNVAGSLRDRIAQIMERSLHGAMTVATVPALRAQASLKIATPAHHLGFRQVFNTRNSLAPIRSIFSRP
jgi:hypothetical protein